MDADPTNPGGVGQLLGSLPAIGAATWIVVSWVVRPIVERFAWTRTVPTWIWVFITGVALTGLAVALGRLELDRDGWAGVLELLLDGGLAALVASGAREILAKDFLKSPASKVPVTLQPQTPTIKT